MSNTKTKVIREYEGDPQIPMDMDAICNAMKAAKKYGLETEVIWSAMGALQGNPEQTIEEAIAYGLDEWIK